jgi:hypothetical protein
MNPDRATDRQFACCLILSAVLILGIVQWSFLPILIQSAPLPGKAVLEVSTSHTSKFAAPFKCFSGDSLKPCLSRARISTPRITPSFFHRSEEPAPDRDVLFFSHRQLRAPPSA